MRWIGIFNHAIKKNETKLLNLTIYSYNIIYLYSFIRYDKIVFEIREFVVEIQMSVAWEHLKLKYLFCNYCY